VTIDVLLDTGYCDLHFLSLWYCNREKPLM